MLVFQIKVTSSGSSSIINETIPLQNMMYRFVPEITEVTIGISEQLYGIL